MKYLGCPAQGNACKSCTISNDCSKMNVKDIEDLELNKDFIYHKVKPSSNKHFKVYKRNNKKNHSQVSKAKNNIKTDTIKIIEDSTNKIINVINKYIPKNKLSFKDKVLNILHMRDITDKNTRSINILRNYIEYIVKIIKNISNKLISYIKDLDKIIPNSNLIINEFIIYLNTIFFNIKDNITNIFGKTIKGILEWLSCYLYKSCTETCFSRKEIILLSLICTIYTILKIININTNTILTLALLVYIILKNLVKKHKNKKLN